VELRFLDMPIEILWQRLNDRKREAPSRHPKIEFDDLARWAAGFEPPDHDEIRLYDKPGSPLPRKPPKPDPPD
jgi:hypothetical protein